jgi:two-component sensor histidine kinase
MSGEPTIDQAFLKEVHHRVKNNLQIVCSLLRLQRRGVADLAVQDVFKRSEERIQSMALVYDKLHRGDGYDTVPLHEYLQEMIVQLVCSVRARDERPQLHFRLTSTLVSSRDATAIGLLVNELVSNHLRVHAPDSQGPLTVIMERREDQTRIWLNETGRDDLNQSGLGVMDQQILDALVRQVNGHLDYPADTGGAACVSFSL